MPDDTVRQERLELLRFRKLNMNTFKSCTADASKFQADMQKDLGEGTSVGISGTPSFVIGRTSPNGPRRVRAVGAQPYAAFDAKLKELLAAAK
jgi:protein-disulfide isomerase